MTEPALETLELGRRYGAQWALRDCTLEIPRGSVTALVGPNGAGKTTLLRLAIGLSRPTAGTVRVLGRTPREHAKEVLPRIGFVAQEHPLFGGFTVEEMLYAGGKLNPRWDDAAGRARIERLGIPLGKKVRELSGGQRAQVALTLALAKQPELLLLDEPVAALDPLARREFLQSVMEAMTERELTVLLSSHIVADLERVCDHLVILAAGRTQLTGPIEEILAAHRLLTGPRDEADDVMRLHEVISVMHTERQTTLLVRANGHVYDSRWTLHELGLEEVVLAYLSQGSARAREEVAS
jgi:ABC-2 type transport system ATP-binding protein